MSLLFQKVAGLPGLESWRADSEVFSFAIIKFPTGRFGASAKPYGGTLMDGSTRWLGGIGADSDPKFASFAEAVAACELFHMTGETG
jgi:hypothetical protein